MTETAAVVRAPWVTIEAVPYPERGGLELRLACGRCGAEANYSRLVELFAMVENGRQFHRSHQLCPEPASKSALPGGGRAP